MKNFFPRLLSQTVTILLLSLVLTSCSSEFGKEVKIKKSSVYYKNIPEADARRAGDFFYNIGYFNDENDISVQITKPKDTVELRFVVDKDKVKPDYDEQYLFIVSGLSDSVFKKAPIVVYLADNEMKDFKRIGIAKGLTAGNSNAVGDVDAMLQSTEAAAAAIGKNVKEVKGNKLYYDDNVEVGKVNALVEYLTDGGYFEENTGHIAVLIKTSNGYVYREAFVDEQIGHKETTEALKDVATSIKQEVFNNDKFKFEVCDLDFKTRQTFKPDSK